jgi:hypothetical protein
LEDFLTADQALRTALTLEKIIDRAEAKVAGLNPVSQVYYDSPLSVVKVFVQQAKKIILPLGKKDKIKVGDLPSANPYGLEESSKPSSGREDDW